MKTCVLVFCLAATMVGAAAAGDIFIPYPPMSSINCNFFPFHVSFGEWRYQLVIGANCLGGKSRILTHISFRPCQSNTFKASTFEMRMSHNTLAAAPSLTFAANMSSPQVVIPAGPLTYIRTKSTWSTIKLVRPFTYNGKDNLTVELRYMGGSLTGNSPNGSDDSFPHDFGYQCYRVFKYGRGAYASTTATSQYNSGMLLTRLTCLDVNISGSGSPSIGGTVNLSLFASEDAGFPYQVGTSFGTGPIIIGKNNLGLSLDQLLLVTVRGVLPSIFQNYSGVLDTTGRGCARIVILNDPQLIGVRLHSAFLTIKTGLAFNVKSISNTFSFTIAK